MKANRSLRTRDDAVSNVLGGILFFSLVFLMLVVIRFEFVPVWEEDKEAARMEQVTGQFMAFKSEVDRQAGNRTTVQVAHPFTLSTSSTSRFFTPANLPGTIGFVEGAASTNLSSSEITVLERSGRSTAAINEQWVSITAPVTLDSVSDIRHLRIRILEPWTESHGDSITLAVTDRDGVFAGSLTVYMHIDPPERFINSRVRGPDNSVIYDQGEAFHQISSVNYWWVDALEDVLHFTDVLHAARPPFTLTFTESGMDGEYTITYVEDTSGGSAVVGMSGVTTPDFRADLASGRLHLASSNHFFVQQDLHFENGALILSQGDQAAMRVPPEFRVASGTSFTRVALTVPALSGQSDSVSQRGTVSLSTDTRSSTHLQATAPDFTYTVATAFPAAWSAFFIRAAEDGGLSGTQYAVSSTPESATITIYGTNSDPAQHDLALELAYANVGLSIKS